MPDQRRHRGPHPKDAEWFSADQLGPLRLACRDLSWLLSRGYVHDSSLALVGNRYALTQRQRAAVSRATCTQEQSEQRRSRAHRHVDLAGQCVAVDALNCLIGVESALSGGVVLVGMDGAHRDLASVHGTYRKVEETERAARLLTRALASAGPREVVWVLDSPVSNSGRVRALLGELFSAEALPWEVELVHDADKFVVAPRFSIAVSCDSWVLDHARGWFDAVGYLLGSELSDAWLVHLGQSY